MVVWGCSHLAPISVPGLEAQEAWLEGHMGTLEHIEYRTMCNFLCENVCVEVDLGQRAAQMHITCSLGHLSDLPNPLSAQVWKAGCSGILSIGLRQGHFGLLGNSEVVDALAAAHVLKTGVAIQSRTIFAQMAVSLNCTTG